MSADERHERFLAGVRGRAATNLLRATNACHVDEYSWQRDAESTMELVQLAQQGLQNASSGKSMTSRMVEIGARLLNCRKDLGQEPSAQVVQELSAPIRYLARLPSAHAHPQYGPDLRLENPVAFLLDPDWVAAGRWGTDGWYQHRDSEGRTPDERREQGLTDLWLNAEEREAEETAFRKRKALAAVAYQEKNGLDVDTSQPFRDWLMS